MVSPRSLVQIQAGGRPLLEYRQEASQIPSAQHAQRLHRFPRARRIRASNLRREFRTIPNWTLQLRCTEQEVAFVNELLCCEPASHERISASCMRLPNVWMPAASPIRRPASIQWTGLSIATISANHCTTCPVGTRCRSVFSSEISSWQNSYGSTTSCDGCWFCGGTTGIHWESSRYGTHPRASVLQEGSMDSLVPTE
jgi:hypothetical protein